MWRGGEGERRGSWRGGEGIRRYGEGRGGGEERKLEGRGGYKEVWRGRRGWGGEGRGWMERGKISPHIFLVVLAGQMERCLSIVL